MNRHISMERALLPVIPICALAFAVGLAEAAEAEERPDWKVGDKWVYHSNSNPPPSESDWSHEVQIALPGWYRVVTESGRRLTLDGDGNSLDGRGREYSWHRLDFPLSVGKRWDHRYKIENQTFQGNATSSWEVEAIEHITVPAGDFDCFRVRGQEWQNKTYLLGPGGASVARGHTITTYWYCPAIRGVAKWRIVDQSWAFGSEVTTVSELTSYRLTP